jgi:hypothetical protein
MKNKKFWVGMLVGLVFGMSVTGCDSNSTNEPTKESPIFFDWNITVKDIPSGLDGENFTMSIIRDGIVKTSKTGVVTVGKATANLKITNMAPKSEITYDAFGKEIWVADIAIKIGINSQLIKTYDFLKLPDGSDTKALVNGIGDFSYSGFY